MASESPIVEVNGRFRVELHDGSLDRGRFHTPAEAEEQHLRLLAKRVLASLAHVRPEDAAYDAFQRSFHPTSAA